LTFIELQEQLMCDCAHTIPRNRFKFPLEITT